jgi:hypothetical protein
MLINRPWPHAGTFGFSPATIFTKLRKVVKLNVPVGYQDETGFHQGVKSVGKDAK